MTRRRILFVSSTIEGGSGRSQRTLARDLITRGHEVVLLVDDGRPAPTLRRMAERLADASVRFAGVGPIRWLETRPGRRPEATTIEQTEMLTSVAPHNAVRRLLELTRPDVVVGSSIERYTWRRIREQCAAANVPAVLYIREATALGHLEAGPTHDAVFANARSLAEAAENAGQPCTFIPSTIDTTPTRTDSTREVALLVNPIATHGIDRLWELADALPNLPFAIQESWELDDQQMATVRAEIDARANVEFRARRAPGPALYGDARVLLVPHRIDNRPRVIFEAHANGIPALVSDHGGLREAVGEGGRVLPDEADAWVDALRRLFEDADAYRSLCGAARREADRSEIDPATVVDRFEHAIDAVLDAESIVETMPDQHG